MYRIGWNITATDLSFIGVQNYVNKILTGMFWSTVINKWKTELKIVQYVVKY